MYPPGAAGVRLVSIGRECARTDVISDVDQEVRDPGRLELFDRSIYITWELVKVSCEGADIHLVAAKRNAVRWKRRSSRNTHDACLVSGKDE
jgi:hypothetical protein